MRHTPAGEKLIMFTPLISLTFFKVLRGKTMKHKSMYGWAFFISLAVLILFLCLCVALHFVIDWFINCTQQEISSVPPMAPVALVPEDAERLYQNLEIQEEEPSREIPGIRSMDISQDGKFLLAREDSMWILDQDLTPQSHFSLSVNSAFYVMWSGENILIILERGNDCVEITQQGDLVGAYQISTADNRNENFLQAVRLRNVWEAGIDSYRLERAPGLLNLFAKGEYSRLVVTHADGHTETLLDTTEDLWKSVFLLGTIVSVGLVLVTAVIVLKMRDI